MAKNRYRTLGERKAALLMMFWNLAFYLLAALVAGIVLLWLAKQVLHF